VPEAATFIAWADSLDAMDYYRVLRVPKDASTAAIKEAFHTLALRCHPDQYVEEPEEVRDAAARVFRRSVEAYGILVREDLRAKYTLFLKAGKLRMTPEELPPQPKVKRPPTYDEMATTPQAKALAAKADALVRAGQVEKARLTLIDATRYEPDNDRLKAAVRKLYEM
jgi:curved DNA-binding protein CbpA